jgi:hypothetical protein
MRGSGTRDQGPEIRFIGQQAEYRFNNGENTSYLIRKGIVKVQGVEDDGKKMLAFGISGPRGGFLTEALLSPQDAAAIGEHLLRQAKSLGARCVWPD